MLERFGKRGVSFEGKEGSGEKSVADRLQWPVSVDTIHGFRNYPQIDCASRNIETDSTPKDTEQNLPNYPIRTLTEYMCLQPQCPLVDTAENEESISRRLLRDEDHEGPKSDLKSIGFVIKTSASSMQSIPT